MVTEPPEVSFASCKTRAMNARLLTSADTDDRPTEGVPNTIRLGVFKCQGGYDKISHSLGRELQGAIVRNLFVLA